MEKDQKGSPKQIINTADYLSFSDSQPIMGFSPITCSSPQKNWKQSPSHHPYSYNRNSGGLQFYNYNKSNYSPNRSFGESSRQYPHSRYNNSGPRFQKSHSFHSATVRIFIYFMNLK